jgi:hypothetical protein
MKIAKATKRYDAWLAKRLRILPRDLAKKHELMASAPFPFLRATFYRWAQRITEVVPDVARAPAVLGVGDLHVENFGTWRDAEGRLVWGINDFDETAVLPFTNDLVRLMTSSLLALSASRPRLSARATAEALLDGYRECLAAGGAPMVLAEQHRTLRMMATFRLHDVDSYWAKLDRLPTLRARVPAEPARILRRALPSPKIPCRMVHRVAGLGSLGRERYLAIGDYQGGRVAREVKALAPSAWCWAHGARSSAIAYGRILRKAVRCADPFVRLDGRWIVRRLAPDCSRIEVGSLPRERDEERLVRAMGWETANVHLGSAAAATLGGALRALSRRWLVDAGEAMLADVERDWKEWRR